MIANCMQSSKIIIQSPGKTIFGKGVSFPGLNSEDLRLRTCSFLNIAQIKLNTIPNDSKLDAESKNHNQEPREDNFWERSTFC